jgi:hypothetical protein
MFAIRPLGSEIFAKIDHVWLRCEITQQHPLEFVVVDAHPVWHGCQLKRSQVDRIRDFAPSTVGDS